MREKRLSILVRLVFFDGRRNRGSVVKLENRGSLISVEAAALGAFCLGIMAVLGVEKGRQIMVPWV
jgi:hypothetical protein